jgi:recombination protein RecA
MAKKKIEEPMTLGEEEDLESSSNETAVIEKKPTFDQVASTPRPMLRAKKTDAINATIAKLEKEWGKNTVIKMGDKPQEDILAIPTGILELDNILGVGGFPRGRIIEIYGPEHSGKTSIALACVAEAQKMGGVCAFVDVEHALDPTHATKIGVDINELLLSQPSSGEEALEIATEFIESNAIDVLVVDSTNALVPKAELEGDLGDSVMGGQARMLSKSLRIMTSKMSKSNVIVIFISQLRMKIGLVFGDPNVIGVGNAMKYYASVRLEVKKSESLKENDEVIGAKNKLKIIKNKVAPPFKTAEYSFYYATGYDKEGAIIEMALTHDIFVKSGSWFSYNGEKIGQGKQQVVNFLRENPNILVDVEQKIKSLG